MKFDKASGNKMLKDVIKNSNDTNNSVKITEIPMELIDENEDNEKVFSMEEIDLLAKSIDDEGFFGAIEVWKKPDGRYEISSGHRRYRAMKLLNRSSIPCVIADFPTDDTTVAKHLLSSNIRSRQMTPIDWGNAIRYYMNNIAEQRGINISSRKEAAEYFGFSATKMSRLLSLTNLIPELQEYAKQENFPSNALATANKLDEDKQKELADFIKNALVSEENSDIPTISGTVLSKKIISLRGTERAKTTSSVPHIDPVVKAVAPSIPTPMPSTRNVPLSFVHAKEEDNDFVEGEDIENIKAEVVKEAQIDTSPIDDFLQYVQKLENVSLDTEVLAKLKLVKAEIDDLIEE